MKKTFLTLCFLLFGHVAFAGDITVNWDANSEPNIAGYKVHYGTAHGVYGAPIDVGNVTTYTITGLTANTYYITITAYDTNTNESDYSYEVVKDLPVTPVAGIVLP